MQNLTVSCGLILWVDSFFETWNYIYSYKTHHIFVGTLNPTHESIAEGPWRVVTFLWITSISWVHYGLHGPRLYPSLRSWVATVQRWRTKMSHGERVKAAEVGEQVMGKGQKGWRNIGWWWLRVASWFRSTGFSTCATSCWGVVAHPTLFWHTSCCFMQSLRIVQSGASCNWERCLPWELDLFSGEFLGCKSEFQ